MILQIQSFLVNSTIPLISMTLDSQLSNLMSWMKRYKKTFKNLYEYYPLIMTNFSMDHQETYKNTETLETMVTQIMNCNTYMGMETTESHCLKKNFVKSMVKTMETTAYFANINKKIIRVYLKTNSVPTIWITNPTVTLVVVCVV